MSTSSTSYLTHQWVLASISSAAARFIPVPFLDDMVRDRSRQFAIARTLATHDREFSSRRLKPVYDPDRGFFSSMIGKVTRLPVKLALFPIRKAVRIFGSVRGLPLDLMRTYLMAHTVDRCLRNGMFANTDSEQDHETQAERVREAWEAAFKGIDWRAAKTVFSDAMNQVGHWRAATTELARDVFGKSDQDPDSIDVDPLDAADEIKEGAAEVEAMMKKPEILSLISDFDARFDAALQQV